MPLASDGAELTDTSIGASNVASVRLALRDDVPRRRVVAKNNAPVDPASEAVAQRPSLKSLSNRLLLEEGDVVRLLAIDADWLQGECAGRTGRFLRTALLDNEQLAFAAECRDDGLAQWDLGWRYMEGWSGLALNEARGVEWIRRAADQGFAAAQHSLAAFLEQKRGVAQDLTESRRLIHLSAAQGHVFARHDVARLLMEGDHSDEAFPMLLDLARQGYVPSMKLLARCYDYGQGVEPDRFLAIYWLEQAGEEGDLRAMRDVARRHLRMHNVWPAVEWLRKAVACRDFGAMLDLALIHLTKQGFIDHAAAGALLEAGAHTDDEKTLEEVAYHYYRAGNSVEAAVWWERADEACSSVAFRKLMKCYKVIADDPLTLAKIA